jgi:predicted RNA-binding Zn ribbon-like protein
MRLANKYSVPHELALLYEFLNSADMRTYFEKGEQHLPSDEWKTPDELASWMRARGLINRGKVVTLADHKRAQELRGALRSWLQFTPETRATAREHTELVNRVSGLYPLIVKIDHNGSASLQPAKGVTALGRVLAEFFSLAESDRLNRLKMCSSDECRWVFFDRSKPGNRRWCSSSLCGNRQKTRDYRSRSKAKLLAREAKTTKESG